MLTGENFIKTDDLFLEANVVTEVLHPRRRYSKTGNFGNEDPATQYRRLAAGAIEKYGGRCLARTAEAKVVGGGPTRRRIVIVEFHSMQRIREWYVSPEYAEALKFRDIALDRRRMFLVGMRSSR